MKTEENQSLNQKKKKNKILLEIKLGNFSHLIKVSKEKERQGMMAFRLLRFEILPSSLYLSI